MPPSLRRPGVDYLNPGIPQRPRDNLGPAIVPVKQRLRDDHADTGQDLHSFCAEQLMGRICTTSAPSGSWQVCAARLDVGWLSFDGTGRIAGNQCIILVREISSKMEPTAGVRILEVIAWIGIAGGALMAVATLIRLGVGRSQIRSGARRYLLSRLNAYLLLCLAGLVLLQYSTHSSFVLWVARIAVVVLLVANAGYLILARIHRRLDRITPRAYDGKSK